MCVCVEGDVCICVGEGGSMCVSACMCVLFSGSVLLCCVFHLMIGMNACVYLAPYLAP